MYAAKMVCSLHARDGMETWRAPIARTSTSYVCVCALACYLPMPSSRSRRSFLHVFFASFIVRNLCGKYVKLSDWLCVFLVFIHTHTHTRSSIDGIRLFYFAKGIRDRTSRKKGGAKISGRGRECACRWLTAIFPKRSIRLNYGIQHTMHTWR